MPRISTLRSFDLGDFARRLVRVASPSMFIAAAACGGTTSAGNSQPLAGTGGAQADATPGTGTGGSKADGSIGTGSTPSTGGAVQWFTELPAVDGGYPHCTGAATTFTGPCCVSVRCIIPVGDGACPAASAVTAQDLGYSALGSGQCSCAPIAGPYTQSSVRQFSPIEGACCYSIGVMGCTGRPLLVAGRPRLAPLVRGGVWT